MRVCFMVGITPGKHKDESEQNSDITLLPKAGRSDYTNQPCDKMLKDDGHILINWKSSVTFYSAFSDSC